MKIIIALLFIFSAQISFAQESYLLIENNSKRFDGSPSYLVLIDELGADKGEVVDTVQLIINSISQKIGSKKFSARIFDNKEALNIYSSGDWAEDKKDLISVHLLATYTGELSTNWSKYTVNYFPSAFSDHPIVGKYVSTSLYEPKF
ncbi:hypothetical protein [Sessilibacter sp. MAH4]